jgi:WD40 repeat protein/tetratricopeptide (TPR) repeat protein
MSDPLRLSDLLLRWEKLREQGREITAEELCRDCPEQTPEVDRRLTALRAVYRALDTASNPPEDAEPATVGPGQTQDPIPDTFIPRVPGFEVLGELGRGGMGVVYKARQTRLGRLVALKMIRAGLYAGSDDIARFRAEAEAVARLQHPNIVQIHEVGEAAGRPFFSLEYVEGGSLADRLDGTPWSGKQAAELVEKLARAVAHAHQRGILHRDLKPANVLLTPENRPKVTDFGLAKRLAAEPGAPAPGLAHAGLTQTGAIVGTPSYMPPEQAAGTRSLTTAVDVYALGAILYELLTGRPPFRGATPVDTVLQVLSEEPVSPRRLQPKVARDLDTICLKCLEKTPENRYRSAMDLADDLGRFLAGQPIQARPIGKVERCWRWCRRNPALAGLTAASVVLVLVALLAVSIGLWNVSLEQQETSRQRDHALQERQRAERKEQEAVRLRKQEARARRLAEKERTRAQAHLRESLIRQAQAFHQSTQADRRQMSLAALCQAARIRPGMDLRNEYLQVLDAADLRHLPGLSTPGLTHVFGFYMGTDYLLAVNQDHRLIVVHPQTSKTLRIIPHIHDVGTTGTLSPQGRYLAASRANGPGTFVWDLQTGRLLGELKDPSGRSFTPICIALSDRAKHLVAAPPSAIANRYTIAVYRLASLRLLKVLPIKAQDLDCLRLNHAGNLLAIATLDLPHQTVRLLSIPTGEQVANLPLVGPGYQQVFNTRRPGQLDFSSDGKLLVGAGFDGTVRIWNIPRDDSFNRPMQKTTIVVFRVISAHVGDANVARFSPDGRWLATSGDDGRLNCWEVATGRLVVQDHAKQWAPDLQWSISGTRLQNFHGVWQFDPPWSRTVALGATGSGPRLLFSPDEQWLACATYRSLPIVLLSRPETAPALLGPDGGIGHLMAFASDNHQFWGNCGNITSWHFPFPNPVRSIQVSRPSRYATLACNASGHAIGAFGQESTKVTVMDLETGRSLWTRFEPFSLGWYGLFQFSPDAEQLTVAFEPRAPEYQWKLTVWKSDTGKLVYAKPTYSSTFFFRGKDILTLNPHTLATTFVKTGKRLEPLRPLAQGGQQFFFSPDGQLCAEAQSDAKIAIWDFAGKVLRVIIKREGETTSFFRFGKEMMAFNRVGSRFAAFDGAYLKVWNTRNGKEVGRLPLDWQTLFFFYEGRGKLDQLLLCNATGHIQSWRIGHGVPKPLAILKEWPGLDPHSCHAAARGTRLVAQANNDCFVWELPSGALRARHPIGYYWRHVAVSEDGRKLGLAAPAFVPKVVNCVTEETLLALDRQVGDLNPSDMHLNRDGSYLVFMKRGQKEPKVLVFDLANRRRLLAVPGAVNAWALSNGGRGLALGKDKRIIVYDPRARKKIATLTGHEGNVTALDFHDPQKMLASVSSEDGTARLWDPRASQLLATIRTGQRKLSCVALSVTGRWLATSDVEGVVRVWDLAKARRELRRAGLDWRAPPIPPLKSLPANSTEVLLVKARTHYLFGRFAEAAQDYTSLIARGHSRGYVYWERGQAHLNQKHYPQALADLQNARLLAPDLPTDTLSQAFTMQAEDHAKRGDWDRVVTDMKKATTLFPENNAFWEQLALAHLMTHDGQGYRQVCKALLNQFGKSPDRPTDTDAEIAWIFALSPDRNEDGQRIVQGLERKLVDWPAAYNLLNTLGAAYFRSGRFQDARKRLQEAIIAHGAGGEEWDWLFLAMTFLNLGQADQARTHLEKSKAKIDRTTRENPWYKTYEMHLLRAEAEALMKSKPTKTK